MNNRHTHSGFERAKTNESVNTTACRQWSGDPFMYQTALNSSRRVRGLLSSLGQDPQKRLPKYASKIPSNLCVAALFWCQTHRVGDVSDPSSYL
jgi:hypothetical protein